MLAKGFACTAFATAAHCSAKRVGVFVGPVGQVAYLSTKSFPVHGRPPLSKIVATIGPVSEDFENLQKCVSAGLRVMRINFSHATFEEATLRMTNLRKSKGLHARLLDCNHNLRAVMLDTKGPEIRMGSLKVVQETGNKRAKIQLQKGGEILLTTDAAFDKLGDESVLYINYPHLYTTVQVGTAVLLDDGTVRLVVKSISDKGVLCDITNSGGIGERKGVNLPGCQIRLPAMSEKDKIDIAFGIKNDIDFIAASFIRRASDVEEIRDFVRKEHAKYYPDTYPIAQIVSKIESTEAIENFEEILRVSDAIMVARGDLGVEIPLNEVGIAQKRMVKRCREVGKPVVVATQMLETMISKPRPTRAEVSDVTNALLDGADCVMLSGESANGDYPSESIATMRSIIHTTECAPELYTLPQHVHSDIRKKAMTRQDAVAASAVVMAHQLHAKAIVVVTKHGHTARLIAKQFPHIPVVCFCSEPKVGRQLQLVRGLLPISAQAVVDWNEAPERAIEKAKKLGYIASGDTVVLVSSAADQNNHHMALNVCAKEV